jgi:DNA-directed RNA polymerase specialized sigma24 family protein
MSGAARAIGPAATCARHWRAAADPVSSLQERERLARTLRQEALRVLSWNGVPAQVREDLAQAVTLTVLGRIVDGAVEPGFEDGYLSVAAKNRARDWHRETSGVYEKTEVYEEESLAALAPEPDPYAVLELMENEADARQLADRVAVVLQRAPTRYREALVAVYLEGVPIEALVQRELEVENESDPVVARRKARARVDKLLQRARDWVRARVVGGRSTPPPPLCPSPSPSGSGEPR